MSEYGQWGGRNRKGRDYHSRGRGRGRGKWRERSNHDNRSTDDQIKTSGRPPHLRGRDIGMWYASKNRAKRERLAKTMLPVVDMESGQERHIRKLLHEIRTSESVQPQPASSGAAIEDDYFEPATEFTASTSALSAYDLPCQSSQSSESLCQEEDDECLSLGEDETPDDAQESLVDIMSLSKEEVDMCFHWQEESTILANVPTGSVQDSTLYKEWKNKQENPNFNKMLDFRKKLPSYKMKDVIVSLIGKEQVVVISGETGCGKTTQVPQFILDNYIERGMGSKCKIICTQPRRISAVSVAERVADERAESCGQGSSVGYQIRLESKMPSEKGSILFCTTGIVLKWLESDPQLKRASHVILDEIHERDLLSDFLMIILRDLLSKRPDLRVILMSATLNAEMFSKYFNDCSTLNIPGFTFPVKEYLLEDVIDMLRYEPTRRNKTHTGKPLYGAKRWKQEQKKSEEEWDLQAWLRNLEGKYHPTTLETLSVMNLVDIDLDLIFSLVTYISLEKEEGAILVFLPGWAQISDLHKLLMKSVLFNSDKFLIIPLHSLMPTVNQKTVFERPPLGVQKIILATNIAETSITIDDVVHVVDSGKIKVKDFQPDNNLATLESQWVSKANARQRRGRAGRVKPGCCFHLYTSLVETKLRDYLPPEILRTRLEELCLHIKLLKLGKIQPFAGKAMQPPSMESLFSAIVNLQDLNALDQDEELLPLGYHLARMPVDPHTGKMILFGAMFCCLDPILIVAASLGFKDAFAVPLGKEKEADHRRKHLANGTKSDHLMLIQAFQGWEKAKSRGTDLQFCWDNFLSANTLKLLKNMKRQFAELLYDLGFIGSRDPKDRAANVNSNNNSLIKAVICAGLYPNVGKIDKPPQMKSNKNFQKPAKVFTKRDGRVGIHPKSVNSTENNFDSMWMVYHLKMKTNGIFLHDCTTVPHYPLLFFGGKITTIQEEGEHCVSVDDWIIFKATPRIAELVMNLRHELDKLLEWKITNPGVTNLNPSSKEGALMRAIISLITKHQEAN